MISPAHDIIDGMLCPEISSCQVSPVNTNNGLEVGKHAGCSSVYTHICTGLKGHHRSGIKENNKN